MFAIQRHVNVFEKMFINLKAVPKSENKNKKRKRSGNQKIENKIRNKKEKL